MRAVSKSVLFTRIMAGKQVKQYPVSIHASAKTAKAYAILLHNAYKAGNVDEVKRLDPKIPLQEDGQLWPDPRWSLLSVPYEPSAEGEGAEDVLSFESETS